MEGWTKEDSARQNAIDTCEEEGLALGSDEYEARFEDLYRSTLAMLAEGGGE
jgi:hypothetical protein